MVEGKGFEQATISKSKGFATLIVQNAAMRGIPRHPAPPESSLQRAVFGTSFT
jgi:hypothetical protein